MLSNWQLKNQLILVLSILTMTVFGLLIGSLLINGYILNNLLITSSNYMFTQETSSQINIKWVKKANVEELLTKTMQQMDMLNKLYQHVMSVDYQTEQPFQCLNVAKLSDQYTYNYSQCYGIFNGVLNNSNIQNYSTIINTTSILTEFRQIIDIESALYYSTKDPFQFYSLTQGFLFPSGFKPHTRPWYQQQLVHNNQSPNCSFTYGLPYTIYIGGVRVPITRNLVDLNASFQGVIAKDIDFGSLEVLKKGINQFTVYLTTNEGLVIYGEQYNTIINQSLFYIYDQNLTGFNEEDWKYLKDSLYNSDYKFVSDCSQISHLLTNQLCRQNKNDGKPYIIKIDKVLNSPYLMILYKKTDIFIEKEKQLEILFNIELRDQQFLLLMTFISCALSILIFQYCFINLLMQQMKHIIEFTSNRCTHLNFICLQDFIIQKIRKSILTSNTILELFEAIQKFLNTFTNKINNKSTICKNIERIKYQRIKEKTYKKFCFKTYKTLWNNDIVDQGKRQTSFPYNNFYRQSQSTIYGSTQLIIN